ncbi:hypothetical protein AJ87_48905 [Rhizobium yanglingense]|nr:hypothetical protein AJ87_48905 [Rhizobium yanglingense]
MALPDYERPTFCALGLVKPTSRETLEKRLTSQATRYNEFLNDSLLVAQRVWLSNTRIRGFNLQSYNAFSTYPCMNHSTSSDGLEQIEATLDSTGQWEVGRLLFIYMPEGNAQSCLKAQSLDDIPDYMRFMDHDAERKILAVDIPPYGNSSKEAIVERYHRLDAVRSTKTTLHVASSFQDRLDPLCPPGRLVQA